MLKGRDALEAFCINEEMPITYFGKNLILIGKPDFYREQFIRKSISSEECYDAILNLLVEWKKNGTNLFDKVILKELFYIGDGIKKDVGDPDMGHHERELLSFCSANGYTALFGNLHYNKVDILELRKEKIGLFFSPFGISNYNLSREEASEIMLKRLKNIASCQKELLS